MTFQGSSDLDLKNSGKKMAGMGGNSSRRDGGKSGKANGMVRGADRLVLPGNKDKVVRLCSEPPGVMNGDNKGPQFSKRGVQETGLYLPIGQLSQTAIHASGVRPVYVGDTYMDRSPGSKRRFIYPPPPTSFLQAAENPGHFRQSCPQLYDEAALYDVQSQSIITIPHRSRSFNTHGMIIAVPSRSIHDIPHEVREVQDVREVREVREIHEAQDDGNTTTTSGSYTIDHDELTLDIPQTNVFV